MKHTELTPEVIKAARESMNLSQEDFAHKIGVVAMTVSRWERGYSRPQGAGRKNLLDFIQQRGE